MGVLGTAHKALEPLGLAPTQIKLTLNDTGTSPNGCLLYTSLRP